jgi:tetratricopeptide (TPR) repeat protein
LFRYFGIQPDQDVDEQKSTFDSKLDTLLASVSDPELGHELDRTRSFLGALLDLTSDASLYNQLDAEGRYNNTLLALIALLKAESLRQPVILFVDDVQFIDADSSAFLTQLKRSLQADSRSYPLAMIVTYRRDGVVIPELDELIDHEIKLDGIPHPAMTHLVEDILGGKASRELMILVMVRSEGNPYFAEQVVRYLQEEGQLELRDGEWVRIERGRSSVLPSDIRALLVARLDKLIREVKTAVQTASVLGREFDLGVLSQMMGSESTTRSHVTQAEKAAIWSPLNEVRYIFYHGLLRDAAYSMQMRARRQELHILALNALEILYEDAPERHYAELAYHAEEGEIRTKAHRYYTLAGKVSADLYRNIEAVEYYSKALAFTDADDLDVQFDLLVERVDLYSRMGKRDEQVNDLISLEQKAAQLNDNDRFIKVTILWEKYHYILGDYLKAVEYSQRASNHSVADTSPDAMVDVQVTWGLALLRLGKLEEAMQQALLGFEFAKKSGEKKDEAKALSVMGLIALEQKDPRIAHGYLEESLSIARKMEDKRLEFHTLNNLAISEGSVKGDYELAGEYYRQAYEIAKEIGDKYQEGIALSNLGFSTRMQGDLETASLQHENSLLIAREIGNVNAEVYTLINLSAIAGLKKEALRALDFAELAHEMARKLYDRSAEAWSFLYIGHAYLLLEDYTNGQAAYQKSIDVRNELGQPSLAMEPIAGLVEVALGLNNMELASRETEKILAYLDEGGLLDGTDEPLRVYYACYCSLAIQKDPRTKQVLQSAKKMLETQISMIKNERSRELFIRNFPWRLALQKVVEN